MKHLTAFMALVGILFSFGGYTQANDQAAMSHLLKNMKLEKPLVSKMIDDLQKMGRITKEQAAKAKSELKGLSNNDLEKYKDEAVKKIQNGDSERLMNHDFKKGVPKLEQPSLLEKK